MRPRVVASLVTAVVVVLSAGPVTTDAVASTPASLGGRANTHTGTLHGARAAALPGNLRFVQSRISLLGTHTWYEQVHAGRVVFGGWYAVHDWKDGSKTVYDGRRKVSGLTAVKPTVTRSDVVRRVVADRRAASPASTTVGQHVMVLPGRAGQPDRLVWQVVTRDGRGVRATFVDATNGRLVRTVTLAKQVKGEGQVFDPNPVVALQNEDLTDHNDTNAMALAAAYRRVDLPRLDNSHTLSGRWVRIANPNGATSANDRYVYPRADDRFEQVSAYYAVDTAQDYLRELGFLHVNAQTQRVKTDTFPADNSFYDPTRDVIATGTGGVDDAEDLEVVWHEYGHAVQDDQVPGFGSTLGARTIGEGFGDYLAATMSQPSSRDTVKTPVGCLMDWDATSYTTNKPHCLRRVDIRQPYTQRFREEHSDAPIWSGALWRLNLKLGRNRATKIAVEAQFSFHQSITMPSAARVMVRTARDLFPTKPEIADQVRAVFVNREFFAP